MSEERKKVLNMLAEGKITVEESEKLLNALNGKNGNASPDTSTRSKHIPKHLYVKVDSKDGKKVNIRVPMKMLRAGIKLTSILPKEARDKVNNAMEKKGIDFNLKNVNESNLENLLEAFNDFRIEVNDSDDKVNIYCE